MKRYIVEYILNGDHRALEIACNCWQAAAMQPDIEHGPLEQVDVLKVHEIFKTYALRTIEPSTPLL